MIDVRCGRTARTAVAALFLAAAAVADQTDGTAGQPADHSGGGRVAVSLDSQPILSSFVRLRPGESPSITSIEMPAGPSPPVRTATVR